MAKKKEQTRIMTPVGRLSFPYLASPHTTGEYADENYKTDLFVSKDELKDLEPLVKAVVECARMELDNPKLTLSDFKHTILSTEQMEPNTRKSLPESLRDGFFRIRAKAYKDRPYVIQPHKVDGKAVILTEDELSNLKGGDYARLYVSPFYYHKGEGGVALYLNAVQFVRPGEALGQGKERILNEIDEIEVKVEDISLENSLDDALSGLTG